MFQRVISKLNPALQPADSGRLYKPGLKKAGLPVWRDWFVDLLSRNYVTLVSVLIHSVVILIFGSAVLFSVSIPPPEFTAERGFVDSSSETDVPPAPSVSTALPSLPDSTLSPVAPSFSTPLTTIVSTAPSTFALPETAVRAASASAVSTMQAASKLVGTPKGALGGEGLGPAGSGGATENVFGISKPAGDNFFTGYIYDLKQSPDRQPIPMDETKFNAAILEFSKSWAPALLAPYFRSREALSTAQIFIPEIKADEAPKAFGVEQEVQPRLWAAVYKGSFVSPESGKFRFVGRADDIILVRLDGNLVLDGSLHAVTQTERYELNDTIAGPWFSLRKGQKYEIDVLIAEVPGGVFTAWLNIEKENRKYAQRPENKGNMLPVFQLSPTVLPPYKAEAGTFAKIPTMAVEGMVFPAR